jgi:hypothetical protein
VYRCPAEPVDAYVAKGGAEEDTVGRRCLCNGLTASVGHAQLRTDSMLEEPALVTSGDDLTTLAAFFAAHPGYTAADVVDYLVA